MSTTALEQVPAAPPAKGVPWRTLALLGLLVTAWYVHLAYGAEIAWWLRITLAVGLVYLSLLLLAHLVRLFIAILVTARLEREHIQQEQERTAAAQMDRLKMEAEARKAQAEAVKAEHEAQFAYIVASHDDAVFVREADPHAVWRAFHLIPQHRINGVATPPSQLELSTWLQWQSPRLPQNSSTNPALLSPATWPSQVGLNELLTGSPSMHQLIIGVTLDAADQLQIVTGDMRDLVHIAIGGSSGWGKSMFLRVLTYQLLLAQEQPDLVLVDLEPNALAPFASADRLLYPLASNETAAHYTLAALKDEMLQRIDLFARLHSVVGIGGRIDAGLLEVWPAQRRKAVKPLSISFNGNGLSYLVGQNVHRYTRPIERLDFQRLAGGAELRALLYAVLGKVISSGSHQVALMIGLPVEIVQDQAVAKETLRELRSWMMGEHTFVIDEVPVTITIIQIKAMAQPVGSYFAWGLDTRGKWVQPIEVLKKPVGVCDIGFNTVDLFAVEEGQVVNRFIGGDTLGMHRATDTIVRYVRTEYGVTLSLHQADDLIQAYLNRHSPLLYHAKGEVDLSETIHQALDETFAAINQFIRSHWERALQFRHLIITGGGAQALRTWLLPQYPQAIILPNSVTANAEGLARFAVRPGILG